MNKSNLIMILMLGIFSQAFSGEITGKIVFEGRTPKMKKLRINADPVCVSNNEVPPTAEWLIVDENGGIKNVIISVIDGVKGSYTPPETPAILDQRGCVYHPHVLAVMAGQDLEILNNDGLMHNIHALPKVNSEFNKAMPKFKKKTLANFKKAEKPFKIKCDVHPWMGAYIGVYNHPFFAVTGNDGTYNIPGLESGEYVIEAWHEKLGNQTATITVGDGTSSVDFTFKKPSKK